MWELDCEESWEPKNWCFWNVVLEKSLESPLDCKEIQPVHSEGDQPWDFFGGNDAKAVKLQYFGHLMQRVDSLEKTLMLGGIGGRRRRGRQRISGWMASLTQWTWVWVNSRSWWWTRKPGVLQSMGLQKVRHDWATELNTCAHIYIGCTCSVHLCLCTCTLLYITRKAWRPKTWEHLAETRCCFRPISKLKSW